MYRWPKLWLCPSQACILEHESKICVSLMQMCCRRVGSLCHFIHQSSVAAFNLHLAGSQLQLQQAEQKMDKQAIRILCFIDMGSLSRARGDVQ